MQAQGRTSRHETRSRRSALVALIAALVLSLLGGCTTAPGPAGSASSGRPPRRCRPSTTPGTATPPTTQARPAPTPPAGATGNRTTTPRPTTSAPTSTRSSDPTAAPARPPSTSTCSGWRDAGIGVAIMSWWGQGSWEDHHLPAILNAAAPTASRSPSTSSPTPAAPPPRSPPTSPTSTTTTARHPAFLRVSRPTTYGPSTAPRGVFYLFDVLASGTLARWKSAMDGLHSSPHDALVLGQRVSHQPHRRRPLRRRLHLRRLRGRPHLLPHLRAGHRRQRRHLRAQRRPRLRRAPRHRRQHPLRLARQRPPLRHASGKTPSTPAPPGSPSPRSTNGTKAPRSNPQSPKPSPATPTATTSAPTAPPPPTPPWPTSTAPALGERLPRPGSATPALGERDDRPQQRRCTTGGSTSFSATVTNASDTS